MARRQWQVRRRRGRAAGRARCRWQIVQARPRPPKHKASRTRGTAHSLNGDTEFRYCIVVPTKLM